MHSSRFILGSMHLINVVDWTESASMLQMIIPFGVQIAIWDIVSYFDFNKKLS